MRLKSLRLYGFKSFAERTEFTFPYGITCIVGPNGCGKSNVVDAVKWVLGEQKPSALRGSEMADVIFGGTSNRKPLGMSEVSLVFDNDDRSLGVDFAEVEVTRRLYRDGNSEYLLNRSRCRLRDLRELLMDTGSGPGALTFMEQGRIDQILRESQTERRAVFEEAAGVARYKARRKETLRRLERVEADLLRVSDVVEERQKQVRSLKVQAGRAERYKALLEEMNAKRLRLAIHRYGSLLAEREAATTHVEQFAAREEAARAEVSAAASACEEAESELETKRVAATSMETEIATLEGQADTAREKSAFATRLGAELDGKMRWYTDEIESLVERLQELETERQQLRESLSTARQERDARAEAAAVADREGQAARDAADAVRTEAGDISRRHFALLEQRSRLGNQSSKLEAEERALLDRRERLMRRLAELVEAADGSQARLAATDEGLQAATARSESAQAALGMAEAESASIEERVGALRDSSQELDREVSGLRSRHDVLQALEARREGVGQGPRKLLEAAAKEPATLPGVLGILADLIETDPEHAAVVETALGPFATAIVVETLDQALLAAAYVERRAVGRCTFLALRGEDNTVVRVRGDDAAARVASAAETGVIDLVRCAAALRAVLTVVLDDTVVVEDLATARALRAAGFSPSVVTAGGAVLERTGAITTGGAAGGAGIVQRQAELRRIAQRLASTTERLEGVRTELTTAKSALQSARDAVVASRVAVRAADTDVHRARGEHDRARAEVGRLGQERERLAGGEAEIESAMAGVRVQRADAQARAAEASHDVEAIEGARHDADARLRAAEEASRAAESRRADARVELAGIRERCTALEQRSAAVEREALEHEQGVVDARKELESCEQRRQSALERGQEARKQMEDAQRRRDLSVRELVELRHAVSVAQRSLEERRGLRKTLDAEAAAVNRELSRFRMRQNEARLRVENLLERVRDELEIDLHEAWGRKDGTDGDGSESADADSEASPAEPQDGSTPVYAESQSSAPTAEVFDPEEVEKTIAELKDKLGRMGAVNLEALVQLEDAESEAEYLLAQHADLTKSRDALLEAIKRIDKESRALFTSTFEAIQINFREMFRKLFGGGKADVFLEPGQDVLEAGVEIVARPPGKEQRSISLLSGGERTMTAVALMFAIYMARPSPFCLLDEVDAALDEGNIDRFVAAVHEFSAQSQFIVVTHNKRTMGMADTIFGVSMPEPGVSKRLAVRLEDVDEDGALRVDAA